MAWHFDYGDRPRFTATFLNVATGAYETPDQLFFKAACVNGMSVEYELGVDPELVEDSEGHFHVDYGLAQEGKWWYRFEGLTAAGDPYGAGEKFFIVVDSYFY